MEGGTGRRPRPPRPAGAAGIGARRPVRAGVPLRPPGDGGGQAGDATRSRDPAQESSQALKRSVTLSLLLPQYL
jgi:hypothetical protein